VAPSAWPIVGSLAAFVTAVGAIWSMKSGHQDFWAIPSLFVAKPPAGATPDQLHAYQLQVGAMSLYLSHALFGLGVAGLLYTFIGWWRDVIKESVVNHDHTPVVKLGLRYGMILFIASEVMFFVAWFWAYFNSALFPKDVGLTGWPPAGIQTFDPC